MIKRGVRRIAVFAGTAALAGGAVAGCGSEAATTGGSGSSQQQQRGAGGMDLTALAEALGVSTAKLQAAMQQNMPQPVQRGQGGRSDDMAANLAKELGLSESKVKAALEKLRPEGGPPAGGNGQAPPSETPSNSTAS